MALAALYAVRRLAAARHIRLTHKYEHVRLGQLGLFGLGVGRDRSVFLKFKINSEFFRQRARLARLIGLTIGLLTRFYEGCRVFARIPARNVVYALMKVRVVAKLGGHPSELHGSKHKIVVRAAKVNLHICKRGLVLLNGSVGILA